MYKAPPAHTLRTQTTMRLPIQTQYGVFMVRYSGRGLKGLDFPTVNSRAALRASSTTRNRGLPTNKIRAWHRTATIALAAALDGVKPRRIPPLDLSAGTHFQRRVWHVLRRIPTGKVRTYGQVARAIGKPGAARAVGGACRANPIPIFVPCHRVIGACGQLGGFSAGLKWKRLLLALERTPRSAWAA